MHKYERGEIYKGLRALEVASRDILWWRFVSWSQGYDRRGVDDKTLKVSRAVGLQGS